ncbi:uncharacterized protein LOC132942608 [Metopolophium dirhodum]|uniref:uncharacterized protein LOC132942608 n=1 Tax=Metopolophium dirhodum TaxID=44670 RepID=UPI00298F64F0|nr:uncharacterized protein LOC132942608 [Metopolophium dirhodum]XP_060867147.1 uncharacterized protein LOC132942608 [Metopolophium dirhodum]
MSRNQITVHPVDGNEVKGAKNILTQLPHYYLPGLNTYLLSNIKNSNEAIGYYSTPDRFNLPVPCIKFADIESKINAVLDMVNLKIQWKRGNKKLLRSCQKKLSFKTLNDIKTAVNTNKSTMYSTIPNVLSHFTSNLMENPDKYFDSECNWYFSNTIEKFQINGKWLLACARGVNLDILDIISIDNNTFEIIQSEKDKCFKDPIFDIKSSNLNDLMIRHKTKLSIFRNNSDLEHLLNNNSVYDNCDIPFADADVIANNFCTADVKHIIKLWKDGNCIQNKYFDVVYDQIDSFIHLNYLQNESNLIGIINRQKLYLMDARIDISKPCSIYDPTTIIELCEELTTLKSSNLNSHSIYVTSNHSVLTFDNRMGFVNKSYHMLSNSPSLINIHRYENNFDSNEMLFLGNQTGESLVYLPYTSYPDGFLSCQSITSSIPNPLQSLHNVRLKGCCLNPSLLDRFSRCLTGTTVFGEHIKDLKLFSINSAGDLFVQKVNDNTPIDVTEFNKNVTIKSQMVPKLNYSYKFDMSNLWQLDLPDKHEEINIKKDNVWSMSKEKMSSYVDHLAPIMLSPWDIDELSEWENEDENDDANDDSDCDFATKVNFWFNKNDTLLRSTETLEPSTNHPPINIFSQASTAKTVPSSENDNDSSSGFTVSLKSDDS